MKKLPADFISQFPGGVAIAYSVIPVIQNLPEPLQTQVKNAFAESVAVFWQVLIGIAGMGFVASLFMNALPLHTEIDKRWGLEEGKTGEKEESVELNEQ